MLRRIFFILAFSCALVSSAAFGQGVIVPPQTALKTVNGITSPIANATITVCAANASGIPCSPALSNSLFSDAALTHPLSNPFTADANGNYNFAIAPGNYTVTVTALGFSGYSYQVSAGNGTVSSAITLQTNGSNNSVQSVLNLISGAGVGVSNSGGNDTFSNTGVLTFAGRAAAVSPQAGDYAWPQIGAGSNLNTQTMGSGGSLTPLNLGQVAGSGTWFPGGLVAAVATDSNSGGSFVHGHVVNIEYTLVSAAGETTASAQALNVMNTNCVSGSSCSITVSAPLIPAGYTGYTVYTNDQNVDGVYHKQTASNACVNITGSCLITAVQTGSSGPPTTNTAFAQPPGVQVANAAPGILPSLFFQKTDGNYYPWMGVEVTACGATSGPVACNGVLGTPTFFHRTYFDDGQDIVQPGKNAFVAMSHNAGVGTLSGNQDRTLWLQESNPSSDSTTRYGLEVLQLQQTFNGNGGINGSPDGEVTAISGTLTDNHTSPCCAYTGYGWYAQRLLMSENGTATWSSCTVCAGGQHIIVNVGGSINFGSIFFAGINSEASYVGSGASGLNWAGYYATTPGTRFPTANYGFVAKDFGSNASDYDADMQAGADEQGKVYLEGKTYLNHVETGGFGRGVHAPTCSSTGTGTSPTCSIDLNGNDFAGTFTVTADVSASSSGTLTLTYHSTYGPDSVTSCVGMLSNAGTGSWNARATVIGGAMTATSAVFNWDNNAVNLTAASTYKFNYVCIAR